MEHAVNKSIKKNTHTHTRTNAHTHTYIYVLCISVFLEGGDKYPPRHVNSSPFYIAVDG
jgi:hypothetical protein